MVCEPASALALLRRALAGRGLGLCPLGRALFRAAPLGGALLGRLLGGLLGRHELGDRLARNRVGYTEVAAEVFEEAAHLVQRRGHLLTAVDDDLQTPPL